MEDSSHSVEQRLRAAVESSPSGLLMIDAKGTIVLVNRQVELLFGYSREELLGRSVDILVPDRFRERHPIFRTGFMADPRIRAMGGGRDLFGLRKDGTEIPVEIGLNPIATNEGLFVISSIVDIRGRKRAEERFRAAVEGSPNGMIMTDAGGRVVLVNRETERLFGYSREELIGQPVELLVPPRFRHRHPDYRAGFYHNPETRSMGAGRDLFGLRKDGVEIPVEIGLTPIETEEGLFVLSSVVDIGPRKEAEQALRESEELFRLLVNGVRDYAIVMLDVDGLVVSWNEGAERIIGYRTDEIIGKSLVQFYPESLGPGRAAEHLKTAREAGTHEEEGWRVRKDGTLFWASAIMTALRSEHGELRGYATVTRDITERRQLEEQLRQAQKMEAVGALAGGVAHDFNNILAAIVGFAELARERIAGIDDAVFDLNDLLQAAGRGKALVERILAFSRRQEAVRRPIAIGSVMTEALTLLRASLPSTIEIRREIDPHAPRVLADSTAIQQVLMNLATNAAHAMPRGGMVEMALRPLYVRDSVARANPDLHEGPYALLTVTDSGHGMDEATRRRALEPFFTTKEAGSGTGLGLAMVHAVMRDHEGAVVLESELGKGTTVRCFFPALTSESVETVAAEVSAPGGQGERVLYLDDEPTLARLGERRLSGLGYRPSPATNPLTALEIFRAGPDQVDLVVTDYTMPGMTGLEFAKAIHAIRPDLPIIMLTGFVEEIAQSELEKSGIRSVLRKPTTIDELALAIHEVLHPHAASSE